MILIFQGIDLVNVDKLQRVIARHSAFVEDIYTPRERKYCMAHSSPHRHLAARFAVKEACLKALGQGISSSGIGRVLTDIEVLSKPHGPPELILHGWAAALGKRKHIVQRTVSISHSGDYAVAMVVLVGMDPFHVSSEGF